MADGRLDATENRILLHSAEVLGFSAEEVENLIGLISGAASRPGQQPGRTIQQSYAVLGCRGNAGSEIKKSYRRLMNQHHPDKLGAKGMPEEMIKLATEKTQEIRAAWEHFVNIEPPEPVRLK
ncbi:MAG: hypothetical protein CM1200mP20_17410 [Pseudomonadota bacterium]|nr:MAG: hypothetical protein CM1200mP20_17410 [Pseudomonadota bacterium]